MTFRPDEAANSAEVNRYKENKALLNKGVGVASTIAGGLGYGKFAQKILPYLSEGVPFNMAIKGIQKFSPEIANLLKRGQNMGLDLEAGKEFVKEKLATKVDDGAKTLFRKLTGDIDISQLDEKTTKELTFLERIASQLESKGKSEKDPEVKSLKKKIQKALKGMTGMLESEAMQMPQENIPQPEQQMQPPQQQQQIMDPTQQQQQPQPGMQQQQQQDPAYNDLLAAIKQAQGLIF